MKKKSEIETTIHKRGETLPSIVFPILVITFLGIILYSNTLNDTFHYDDMHNIVDNTNIRDITNLKAVWNSYYLRFVGSFTFALNYHLDELDVFGFHVVNISIHILTAICVWWLTLLIFSTPVIKSERIAKHKKLAALACGLIFVSHPIQTQAVAYIVQRYASLATLFYIASLCFYMKARLAKSKPVAIGAIIATAFSAILGMFTKETVVTLPFAIILFEVSFFYTGGLKTIMTDRRFLTCATPVLLFSLILPPLAMLRYKSLLRSVTSQRFHDPLLTPFIYLITQFRVLVTYIRLLFLPINQNLEYDYPASTTLLSPAPLLSLLFHIGLLVTAIWLFPKRRLISVGIFWFFLTLSVESSVITLGNVIFEHRLYLPMFGFCLIVMSLLFQLIGNNMRALVITLVAIITVYSLLTYNRNKIWDNEYTLWGDVVKKSPAKTRPLNNLGVALYEMDRIDESIDLYKKALEINPTYDLTYYNLGNAYKNSGKHTEALVMFKEAIRLNPKYTKAYNNMGNLLRDNGRYEEAEAEYRKALQIEPDYHIAHNNLGNVLRKMGKHDEAIQEYLTALKIMPKYPEAHNNLGNAYSEEGKNEEAMNEYRTALSLKPDYPEAHSNLGIVLNRLKRYDEALLEYAESLRLDPQNIGAYNNMGDALRLTGRLDEAIQAYTKALDMNPNIFQLHCNIGLAYQQLENLEQAEKHFKTAVTINDRNELAYYILGSILKERSKIDEAVTYFQKAIELKPDYGNAHRELALCYRELGNDKAALTHTLEYNRITK